LVMSGQTGQHQMMSSPLSRRSADYNRQAMQSLSLDAK
jgi:hypothetical protein